jgi:phosphatidylglycerol lysyltransferase
MSNDAPNGVIDYLLVNLFDYYKTKEIKYVNLGLVPLAGIEKAQNITERVLKFAFENIKNFKHYRGLRDYKEKFSPEWSNKYLAYSSDFELVSLPAVLKDIGKMNR